MHRPRLYHHDQGGGDAGAAAGQEERYQLKVGAGQAGTRLDRLLADRLPYSRSRLQRLIEAGRVEVDGDHRKPAHRVSEGQTISVRVPPPAPSELQAQDIPLDIVYEDDHLAVVNKPAAMVVHPAPGHPEGTMVNALLYHLDDLSGVGGERRPGIVHRLDKDTTGLLVVAKEDAVHRDLSEQLRRRAVKRRYVALVHGTPEVDSALIDAPVGRHPRRRREMAVVPEGEGGRAARTRFEVVERLGGTTLLSLDLDTGRTHQIRVHLQYIGHPVVGDPVYRRGAPRAVEGADRQMLHARQLSFEHPVSGEGLTFKAPPPADLCRVLGAFDSSWALTHCGTSDQLQVRDCCP